MKIRNEELKYVEAYRGKHLDLLGYRASADLLVRFGLFLMHALRDS